MQIHNIASVTRSWVICLQPIEGPGHFKTVEPIRCKIRLTDLDLHNASARLHILLTVLAMTLTRTRGSLRAVGISPKPVREMALNHDPRRF